jgi:hypothetical protein
VHEIKHDGYRMIVCRDGEPFVSTAARQSIGRRGCRRSQKASDRPFTPPRHRPCGGALTANSRRGILEGAGRPFEGCVVTWNFGRDRLAGPENPIFLDRAAA